MARKKKNDDEPDDDDVVGQADGGVPATADSAASSDPAAADEPDVPPAESAEGVAADPEQPPASVAEQPAGEEGPVGVQVYKKSESDPMTAEGRPPEGETEGKSKRRGAGKLYTLQVRRNDSEWANVAHTTVTTHADHRDRQQAAIGYTKGQAAQVKEDWERAGYEVQLVEVREPEQLPEPEPEPEPEPVVEQ